MDYYSDPPVIKMLSNLECVQSRPGLYLSTKSEQVVYELLWEALNWIAGFNPNSPIEIMLDKKLKGVGMYTTLSLPIKDLQLELETLHFSDRKQENNLFKTPSLQNTLGSLSYNLNGIFLVNALSDNFSVSYIAQDVEKLIAYKKGKNTEYRESSFHKEWSGIAISIWFAPNKEIFETRYNFNYQIDDINLIMDYLTQRDLTVDLRVIVFNS